MSTFRRAGALFLFAPLFCGNPVSGQLHPAPQQPTARQVEVPLTPATRRAVIAELSKRLRSDYVFPEVAKTVADALASKLKRGGYDGVTGAAIFAEQLTQDLRDLGRDAHLRVRYAPDYRRPPRNDDKPSGPAEAAAAQRLVAQGGYGIGGVQRLPGNIGYLDVRGFRPTPLVANAYAAAMTLISGSDALIVDLRQNGGGEPQSVAELASYFFAGDDVRHLNDLYIREGSRTQEFWTNPKVAMHYAGPVYVLTSKRTFSGGEEFAYDLQTQKRATLVGETTGGGANPGDYVFLPHGFIAFVPDARAINPVTKGSWEHVGVQPDVPVSAGEAMKTAYVAALKRSMAAADGKEQRESLSDLLRKAENDGVQLPGYTPAMR